MGGGSSGAAGDISGNSGGLSQSIDEGEAAISSPRVQDVICGRGGGSNNHPGNVWWRNLVSMSKHLYLSLPKRLKMLLAQNIVNRVRIQQDPAGRFLQKDEKSGMWKEIGDVRARDKTSQALRESAPLIRKGMEEAKKALRFPGTSAGGGGEWAGRGWCRRVG